jgi:hypothetical protein
MGGAAALPHRFYYQTLFIAPAAECLLDHFGGT